MLANVEALGQESDEEPIMCSRIVRSCTCKTSNNGFAGMSILECEEYEWHPPMVQQSCTLTTCPPNSSC